MLPGRLSKPSNPRLFKPRGGALSEITLQRQLCHEEAYINIDEIFCHGGKRLTPAAHPQRPHTDHSNELNSHAAALGCSRQLGRHVRLMSIEVIVRSSKPNSRVHLKQGLLNRVFLFDPADIHCSHAGLRLVESCSELGVIE